MILKNTPQSKLWFLFFTWIPCNFIKTTCHTDQWSVIYICHRRNHQTLPLCDRSNCWQTVHPSVDRWEVVTEMEVTITVITMYQQLRAHVTLLLTGYWKTICQALVTPGGGCHYKPLVSLAEHSSGLGLLSVQDRTSTQSLCRLTARWPVIFC